MLIGFAGFKRSGKDTAGKYFYSQHAFHQIAFAQKIKAICQDVFDFSIEQVYGDLKEVPDKRYPFSGDCVICGTSCGHDLGVWVCPRCGWLYEHDFITPRLAMQTLGTEWGRRLFGDVWISHTLRTVQKHPTFNWAITDVRFQNEVLAIKKAGGVVVRLMRGELNSSHQSEKELAEMDQSLFDFVIDNNGTIETFHNMLENVYTVLHSRP